MFQPYRHSPTALKTVALYMFIKINSLVTAATVAPLIRRHTFQVSVWSVNKMGTHRSAQLRTEARLVSNSLSSL